jgi:hypothetical protein
MTPPDVDDELHSHEGSAAADADDDRGGTPLGRSRLWIVSALAIAAVLALLAGAVFALLTHMNGVGMENPTTPDSGQSSGGSRPVPAEVPGAALAAPRPTDCRQIYSPDMFAYLESTGLPLNDGSVENSLGTTEESLVAVIERNETFKCSWGYAGEYGLNTSITQVSADDAAAVVAELAALDFECYDDLAGSRCIRSETISDDSGTFRTGESHFVRGGVWIATHWVEFAPDDYTQDIVASLWPPA